MAMIQVVYIDGDVRATAGAQVDEPNILDTPEAVAEVARRLVPALKVFVTLEQERIAKAKAAGGTISKPAEAGIA